MPRDTRDWVTKLKDELAKPMGEPDLDDINNAIDELKRDPQHKELIESAVERVRKERIKYMHDRAYGGAG